MGCDIHAYVDYNYRQLKDGDGWYVVNWARDIDIDRNYTLFALMAGVRYDPRTDGSFKPLFKPRGIPGSVSWEVSDAYCLRVSEEWQNDDGYCSPELAVKWTTPYKEGWEPSSKWMNEEHTLISQPDWHSASWLTAAELEQVIKVYEAIEFPEQSWFQFNPPEEQPIPDNAVATKMERRYSWSDAVEHEWYVEVGEKKTYQVPTAFKAIAIAMKELNGDDPERSRLVFWFDN